jgi:hypothetical protein
MQIKKMEKEKREQPEWVQKIISEINKKKKAKRPSGKTNEQSNSN